MASDLTTLGVVATGFVAYGSAWVVTSRHSFHIHRKAWMDEKIRSQRAWEARRPKDDRRVSKSGAELLEKVRNEWKRKGVGDASELAFFAGALWPLYWISFWVARGPEPSTEEKALMDLADYERLKELERQAGLRPLDELEGDEG